MTVLAIETATAVCAAAMVRDAAVLAENSLNEKHIHSEKLVSIIDTVIRQAGDFEAIAISVGPGSFTGLRIGLSVTKGLAFASDKPIVAVPTLEALAWRAVYEGIARDGDEVIAMIDARRNDVYVGSFSIKEHELMTHWKAEAMSLEELIQRLPGKGRIIVMGDAVEKFVQQHDEVVRNDNRFTVPPPRQRLCSAISVGLLGVRKAERGEFSDLVSMEPMYVKNFVIPPKGGIRTQHVSS